MRTPTLATIAILGLIASASAAVVSSRDLDFLEPASVDGRISGLGVQRVLFLFDEDHSASFALTIAEGRLVNETIRQLEWKQQLAGGGETPPTPVQSETSLGSGTAKMQLGRRGPASLYIAASDIQIEGAASAELLLKVGDSSIASYFSSADGHPEEINAPTRRPTRFLSSPATDSRMSSSRLRAFPWCNGSMPKWIAPDSLRVHPAADFVPRGSH
ncbi:MAG: hypothetical protein AABX89_04435 [Candidatus Thermoplasmatota archaeon]